MKHGSARQTTNQFKSLKKVKTLTEPVRTTGGILCKETGATKLSQKKGPDGKLRGKKKKAFWGPQGKTTHPLSRGAQKGAVEEGVEKGGV